MVRTKDLIEFIETYFGKNVPNATVGEIEYGQLIINRLKACDYLKKEINGLHGTMVAYEFFEEEGE